MESPYPKKTCIETQELRESQGEVRMKKVFPNMMFQTLRQLRKIEKGFQEGGRNLKMEIEVIDAKEYLSRCREEEPWDEGKSD